MATSSDTKAVPPLAKGLRIQIVQPAQALDPAQLRHIKEWNGPRLAHMLPLPLCVQIYFSYGAVY